MIKSLSDSKSGSKKNRTLIQVVDEKSFFGGPFFHERSEKIRKSRTIFSYIYLEKIIGV